MEVKSPYIKTKLNTTVILYPNQMNNNLYINLKKNLMDDIENKCLKDYGYVDKVYEITEYKNGCIEAENILAAASYDIEFSCKLCRPIRNRIIIAQVKHLTRALIKLENGPIMIFVTDDNMDDVYLRDNYGVLRVKENDTTKIVDVGDFVKIKIIQFNFNNADDHIVAIGYMLGQCTDKEIKKFYEDIYGGTNSGDVDFSTYKSVA